MNHCGSLGAARPRLQQSHHNFPGMETIVTTAPTVERDSILETLEQHLLWKNAYIGFLKRMMEKALEGTLTGADEEQETMQRREEQYRQEDLENMIVAHAGEPWAEAYVSALESEDA